MCLQIHKLKTFPTLLINGKLGNFNSLISRLSKRFLLTTHKDTQFYVVLGQKNLNHWEMFSKYTKNPWNVSKTARLLNKLL